MLSMIRQLELELRDAFVYNSAKRLAAEMLISLIDAKPPIGRKRRQTYNWFLNYIRGRDSFGMLVYHFFSSCTTEKATLNDILQFCTGLREVERGLN